jgi:hypothetical protein
VSYLLTAIADSLIGKVNFLPLARFRAGTLRVVYVEQVEENVFVIAADEVEADRWMECGFVVLHRLPRCFRQLRIKDLKGGEWKLPLKDYKPGG